MHFAYHQQKEYMKHLQSNSIPKTTRPLAIFIDDNEAIRDIVKMFMTHLGYDIFEAGDGQEGILAYQPNRSAISIVVLDMEMPVKNGVQTLRELLSIDPQAKVIMMTGTSDPDIFRRIKRLSPR